MSSPLLSTLRVNTQAGKCFLLPLQSVMFNKKPKQIKNLHSPLPTFPISAFFSIFGRQVDIPRGWEVSSGVSRLQQG